MTDKVVALVPCKDGSGEIGRTVRALSTISDLSEILVIDDGSRDATAEESELAGARVVRSLENQGKGAALARGIEAAPDADIYLLVDADTQDTSVGVVPLLAAVKSGSTDLAIGVLPSARGRGGFGAVKNLSAALIDRCCGFDAEAPLSGQRAIRGHLLRSMRLAPRFGVEAAMTVDAVRAGARVQEIPVQMEHSHTGKSFRGFAHRAGQGSDIVRALWPRLLGRLPRIALGIVALLLLAAALMGVAERFGASADGESLPPDRPVKVIMVPGLQWPDSEWRLPANVSVGSVVTNSNDAVRTVATGKAQPEPNAKAIVEVEFMDQEEFTQSPGLRIDPGQLVFLVGAAQPDQMNRERPALLFGADDRGGELTSGSTKRAGLIDLRDISALVDPVESEGSAVLNDPTSHPTPQELADRSKQVNFYDRNNPTFIIGYLGFIVLVCGLAAWSWKRGGFEIRSGAYAIAAVPLAAFLVRWVTAVTEVGVLAWSAFLAAIVGMIVVMAGSRAKDVWTPLRRISLLTVLVISIDVLSGSHLQQSGLFGSSPSLGARYYGLGNPASTVLLLAAITWSVLYVKALPVPMPGRPWFRLSALWLSMALITGLPNLGADVGGLLVSVGVGVVLVSVLIGLRFSRKKLLVSMAAGAAAIVVAGVLDSMRAANDRTHLGNLFDSALESGPLVLVDAAMERAAANLFGYGFPFSLAIPALIVGLLAWCVRRSSSSRVLPAGSFERIGVISCIGAAAALWAVNDSGIVVLVLAGVFVVPLILVAVARANDTKYLEMEVR